MEWTTEVVDWLPMRVTVMEEQTYELKWTEYIEYPDIDRDLPYLLQHIGKRQKLYEHRWWVDLQETADREAVEFICRLAGIDVNSNLGHIYFREPFNFLASLK